MLRELGSDPRVGVAAIVRRDGRILFGLRTGSHGSGTWSLPGGALDYGEAIRECAVREVREETGLVVSPTSVLAFTEDVFPEGKHFITFFVECNYQQGEPERMEPAKCLEWRWCDPSELPTPLFLPIVHLLEKGHYL